MPLGKKCLLQKPINPGNGVANYISVILVLMSHFYNNRKGVLFNWYFFPWLHSKLTLKCQRCWQKLKTEKGHETYFCYCVKIHYEVSSFATLLKILCCECVMKYYISTNPLYKVRYKKMFYQRQRRNVSDKHYIDMVIWIE